jgi:hypothetical protein
VAEARINNHAAVIWAVADLLRGDYKQSEYGKVILPLTVLRRLDCVLEPTKVAVLNRAGRLKGHVDNVEPVLQNVAGQRFYNTLPLDFRRLLDDPGQVAGNLRCLPGPDFHRLALVSFSLGYVMRLSPSSQRPSCWTHSRTFVHLNGLAAP